MSQGMKYNGWDGGDGGKNGTKGTVPHVLTKGPSPRVIQKKKGLTRNELLKATGLKSSQGTTRKLEEL